MSEDTEADVAERDPDVEDEEGHGVDVEGGGDPGASAPEETDDIEAERDEEREPDERDEVREERAAEVENVDNHRDEEPHES